MRQEKLGNGRIVDVGADGSVVGVEFIAPSRGLDLVGVPRAAEIARDARRRGMRVLPASDVAGLADSTTPSAPTFVAEAIARTSSAFGSGAGGRVKPAMRAR